MCALALRVWCYVIPLCCEFVVLVLLISLLGCLCLDCLGCGITVMCVLWFDFVCVGLLTMIFVSVGFEYSAA